MDLIDDAPSGDALMQQLQISEGTCSKSLLKKYKIGGDYNP